MAKSCAICGAEIGLLSGKKLHGDGSKICNNCASIVPKPFKKSFFSYNTKNDYEAMKQLVEAQAYYAKQFADFEAFTSVQKVKRKSYSYAGVSVDYIHGIIRIQNGFSSYVYLSFEQVSDYGFYFEPEELKDGLLTTRVKGTCHGYLVYEKPFLVLELFNKSDKAKAAIKKGFFRDTLMWAYPKNMTFIYSTFVVCANTFSLYINDDIDYNKKLEEALVLFKIRNEKKINVSKVQKKAIKLKENALYDGNREMYGKICEAYRILTKNLDGIVDSRFEVNEQDFDELDTVMNQIGSDNG